MAERPWRNCVNDPSARRAGPPEPGTTGRPTAGTVTRAESTTTAASATTSAVGGPRHPGAWAALASVVMIVVQIALYVAWPPPEDHPVDLFELLLAHPVRASSHWTCSTREQPARLPALPGARRGAVEVRTVRRGGGSRLRRAGDSAYMASPRAVEMLTLAHAYREADGAARVALIATGDEMLATWTGTGFDLYYFFNLAALASSSPCCCSRSSVVTRTTALWAARRGPHGVPSNCRHRGARVRTRVPPPVGRVLRACGAASSCTWLESATSSAHTDVKRRSVCAVTAPDDCHCAGPNGLAPP